MRDIKIDDDGTRRIVGEPGNAIPLDDDYGRLRSLDRLPAPPSLRIVDSGHWAFLYRGEGRLLAVSLDGDSIEGRRSPDAEKRLGILQVMVGCWEYMRGNGFPEQRATPVPIVRTYRKAPAAPRESCPLCGGRGTEEGRAGDVRPCRHCDGVGFKDEPEQEASHA